MRYYIIFSFLFMALRINAQSYLSSDSLTKNNLAYKGNPFTNIFKNTGMSFSNKNLIFHLAGFASTYFIIQSGIDYKVHNYFYNHNNDFNSIATPAVYIGYLAPIVIGGGIYTYGKIKNDNKVIAAGSAAIQAALISVVYTSLLKAITGRPNPDSILYHAVNEGSSKFQFGFFRGGIHYGWPSGHLGTNTAVVTSLMYFYKENNWVKLLGGLYLGYLTFSVAAHDGNTMHWTSDIVTGMLIGYAIGSTVGKDFRREWEGNKAAPAKNGTTLSPVIGNDFAGVNLKIGL